MGELIVLADDDAELRSIYAEVLRREGHEVHEASDGAEAIALMRACRPSLVLLDVWMPVVNGFEVLDRLRGEPTLSTTKVVMLSNNTADQIAPAAQAAQDAGTKVVTWDSPIPSAQGESLFVAQVDFDEIGQVAHLSQVVEDLSRLGFVDGADGQPHVHEDVVPDVRLRNAAEIDLFHDAGKIDPSRPEQRIRAHDG